MKLKAVRCAALGMLMMFGAALFTVTNNASSAHADDLNGAPKDLLCSAFNRLTEHGQEDAIKNVFREYFHQDMPGMLNMGLFVAHIGCWGSHDVLPVRGDGISDPNLGTVLQSILPPSNRAQG